MHVLAFLKRNMAIVKFHVGTLKWQNRDKTYWKPSQKGHGIYIGLSPLNYKPMNARIINIFKFLFI